MSTCDLCHSAPVYGHIEVQLVTWQPERLAVCLECRVAFKLWVEERKNETGPRP